MQFLISQIDSWVTVSGGAPRDLHLWCFADNEGVQYVEKQNPAFPPFLWWFYLISCLAISSGKLTGCSLFWDILVAPSKDLAQMCLWGFFIIRGCLILLVFLFKNKLSRWDSENGLPQCNSPPTPQAGKIPGNWIIWISSTSCCPFTWHLQPRIFVPPMGWPKIAEYNERNWYIHWNLRSKKREKCNPRMYKRQCSLFPPNIPDVLRPFFKGYIT